MLYIEIKEIEVQVYAAKHHLILAALVTVDHTFIYKPKSLLNAKPIIHPTTLLSNNKHDEALGLLKLLEKEATNPMHMVTTE